MGSPTKDNIDARIRDSFSLWKKIDRTDVKILEGLSLLGPRNLVLIAKHLDMPTTTVRYRVRRMIEDSILFLHLNPYHTNMGLMKAIVFIEAMPGYEDVLLDCLRIHDYWLFLYRLYGPYEGCGSIWAIPKGYHNDFEAYLRLLQEKCIAKSIEINWTTCHEGIPVQTRWFSVEENSWVFNWNEWAKEVETIEGKLPPTMIEPKDWPIMVDYEDLLIIKELEINGKASLTDISKKLGLSFEAVKYHFREHISKRGLIEGYQVEVYRFPSLLSEHLCFKFEFDSYEKMKKFALSLHDKPFPIFLGKVLGENAMMSHMYLPKWEFRKFISTLSSLIRSGSLKGYHYVIEDIYQVWRETIPYQHFKNDRWEYDMEKHKDDLNAVIEKWGINYNGLTNR